MTTTDETPAGDKCAVCGRPLAVTDTINYNHKTGVLRCMDCEGVPVPGQLILRSATDNDEDA